MMFAVNFDPVTQICAQAGLHRLERRKLCTIKGTGQSFYLQIEVPDPDLDLLPQGKAEIRDCLLFSSFRSCKIIPKWQTLGTCPITREETSAQSYFPKKSLRPWT